MKKSEKDVWQGPICWIYIRPRRGEEHLNALQEEHLNALQNVEQKSDEKSDLKKDIDFEDLILII